MSDQKSGPCTTVANGSVGKSGPNAILPHQVTGNIQKLMVLKTTKTNLCGDTGVIGILLVNGQAVAHGDITADGSSIQATADPEQNVVAIAHTHPLFNGIVCIDPGELYVDLEQCDLVT